MMFEVGVDVVESLTVEVGVEVWDFDGWKVYISMRITIVFEVDVDVDVGVEVGVG